MKNAWVMTIWILKFNVGQTVRTRTWHKNLIANQILDLANIGRSVRSTTASVLQIPTTTTPIIPNRREMREILW